MRSAWIPAVLRALATRSPLTLINGVIPPDACRVSEGIAYGRGPRQQLDIYMPWCADGAPVVVFLYGGSWRSGARGDYKFVGDALASRGFVTVVADYQLYPQAAYPVFLQDCAQAVAWTARNCAEYRGDPERIYLVGHSAGAYDRCISVEMFEHMRNYATLLSRIANWLTPQGKLFVHIFAHRGLMYPFETDGADNWLGRHFFTGGIMPAADTLLWFQERLRVEARWIVDGTHYQRTANHWLANQDAHRPQAMRVLASAYGGTLAPLWFQRWRIFWMACAELFGYEGGQQWLVAHYRFAKVGLQGDPA